MSQPVPAPSSWRGLADRPLVSEPAARYRGYRVPSARLPGCDDGRGVFFVTIVTAGRVPWFCRVRGGRVELADAGRAVRDEWARTGALRPGVALDVFVVMPDPVHGVLVLHGDSDVSPKGGATPDVPAPSTARERVGCGTRHASASAVAPCHMGIHRQPL